MDYGQTNGKMSNDLLFEQAITQGEGTAPENSNPDIAESLHATDDSISWEAQPTDQLNNQLINQPPTPNHSILGQKANRALSSINTAPNPDLIEPIPQPDQIPPAPTPLTMPPGITPADTAPAGITTTRNNLTNILSHLHLSLHHKFTDADAKIVDEAITASGDDISDLYDAVRDLVPVATNQTGGQNEK